MSRWLTGSDGNEQHAEEADFVDHNRAGPAGLSHINIINTILK